MQIRYLSYLTNSFCHIFFMILSSFMKLNALQSEKKTKKNNTYYTILIQLILASYNLVRLNLAEQA